MKTIGAMTIDELGNFIEQKILETLGDPDAGLELREDFKQKLIERLSGNGKRISHKEAVEKFG